MSDCIKSTLLHFARNILTVTCLYNCDIYSQVEYSLWVWVKKRMNIETAWLPSVKILPVWKTRGFACMSRVVCNTCAIGVTMIYKNCFFIHYDAIWLNLTAVLPDYTLDMPVTRHADKVPAIVLSGPITRLPKHRPNLMCSSYWWFVDTGKHSFSPFFCHIKLNVCPYYLKHCTRLKTKFFLTLQKYQIS